LECGQPTTVAQQTNKTNRTKMAEQALKEMVKKMDDRQILLHIMRGYRISRCIFAANELGISDHLANGAKSVEELAKLTNCHTLNLYRLLRTLASIGVYEETEEKHFINTRLSELMRSNVPGSMKIQIKFMLDGPNFHTWADLLHSVKTGEPAIKHWAGMDAWQYFEKHRDVAEIFNKAMSEISNAAIPYLVPAYDYSPYAVIVDLGGGYGTLLSAILKTAPHSKGIVFDLEKVVQEGKNRIDPSIKDRCEFVAGDFFQSVPEGADLYIMKNIIHDWNDEKAQVILKNIRKAMKPTSKLLIMEALIASDSTYQYAKFLDLTMMLITGGKERTEKQFRELLEGCGLKLQNVYNREKRHSILECVPSTD
jgi:hypothetical protein